MRTIATSSALTIANPQSEDSSSVPMADAVEKIRSIQQSWGQKLQMFALPFVPGPLLELFDFTGTSDEIIVQAKSLQNNAKLERIVVYGSRFLAETIDVIFNAPSVRANRGNRRVDVFAPSLNIDCPLIRATALNDIEECWNKLDSLVDVNEVFPIACLSSSTSVKAFCGTRGGAVCSSQNARDIVDRALELKPRVLFLPDVNLGRFAATSVGLTNSDLAILPTPYKDQTEYFPIDASKSERNPLFSQISKEEIEQLRTRKMILWNESCPTFRRVDPRQINALRRMKPNIKIAVSPRCSSEIKELADAVGNYDEVVKAIANSQVNHVWALAFSQDFVNTIQLKFNRRTFVSFGGISKSECEARQFKFERLKAIFDAFESPTPYGLVVAPDCVAESALAAIERMFHLLADN